MPAQNAPAQDSTLTVRINAWFDLKMKRYFGFFISFYKSAEKLFAKKGIDAKDGKNEINTESNKNNKSASDEVIFPTVLHAGSASKTVDTAVRIAQEQAGGKAEVPDSPPKESAASKNSEKKITTNQSIFSGKGDKHAPRKRPNQFRFSFSCKPQWQMTIPDVSSEKKITPLGLDYPSPIPFANPKRTFKPW